MIEHAIRFLLPDMHRIFVAEHRNYIPNVERDYRALREIALFLIDNLQLSGSADHAELKTAWRALARTIASHPFYRTKSLATCSNHIQEIAQLTRDGYTTNRTTRISAADFRKGLDEHFE